MMGLIEPEISRTEASVCEMVLAIVDQITFGFSRHALDVRDDLLQVR